MNIVQLQEQLKNFSQDQLVREMQMPSGTAPQFLVLGEIMRRQKMQQDFAAQQAKGAPQSTVAEDAIAASGVPQQGLASMARSLAPQTDMAGSTGVQAMATGGPVKKMAEGDKIVRGGMVLTEQEDGTYRDAQGRVVRSAVEDTTAIPSDLAGALDIRDGEQERSWGQRNIGDPLRRFFQPIGDAGREIGQPLGETLRDIGEPIGDAAREVGQPVGGNFRSLFTPSSEPTPTATAEAPLPEALTYEEIIARARAGVPPTLEQLQSSVEAGLLNGQQAADVQAMTEGTGYIPSEQEARVAGLPGLTPTVPYNPRLDTPYEYVKQGIGDFVAGAFGGRSMGEQAAIDAERAAAIAAQKREDAAAAAEDIGAPELQNPAFRAAMDERATPEAEAAQDRETERAAEQPTQPATDTTPSGGGTGVGGVSSYEQELMNMLQRREKAAEQDKWLALAQVGLNMMSSTQPTLLGAIGEAGVKGVEAARSARDQYDKDRLDLLGAIEQSRMARAAAAAKAARAAGGNGKPINATMIGNIEEQLAGVTEQIARLRPPSEPSFWTGAIEDPDRAVREQLETRAAMLESVLSQAYATHGLPYLPTGIDPSTYANLSD